MKSPACHILVLSDGEIQLRGEPLHRNVVVVEEVSLHAEAAVILPKKAITIIRYEGRVRLILVGVIRLACQYSSLQQHRFELWRDRINRRVLFERIGRRDKSKTADE